MNVLTSIATFYKQGGMFMHAVLVIAVLIVAIVLERLVVNDYVRPWRHR